MYANHGLFEVNMIDFRRMFTKQNQGVFSVVFLRGVSRM